MAAPGLTIRILDLAFEEPNIASASLLANLVINGRLIGRVPIFVVNATPSSGPPPPLPVQLQNNTLTSVGLTLSLAPGFIQLLNTSLGQQTVTASTQVATLSLFEVFSPDGN